MFQVIDYLDVPSAIRLGLLSKSLHNTVSAYVGGKERFTDINALLRNPENTELLWELMELIAQHLQDALDYEENRLGITKPKVVATFIIFTSLCLSAFLPLFLSLRDNTDGTVVASSLSGAFCVVLVGIAERIAEKFFNRDKNYFLNRAIGKLIPTDNETLQKVIEQLHKAGVTVTHKTSARVVKELLQSRLQFLAKQKDNIINKSSFSSHRARPRNLLENTPASLFFKKQKPDHFQRLLNNSSESNPLIPKFFCMG